MKNHPTSLERSVTTNQDEEKEEKAPSSSLASSASSSSASPASFSITTPPTTKEFDDEFANLIAEVNSLPHKATPKRKPLPSSLTTTFLDTINGFVSNVDNGAMEGGCTTTLGSSNEECERLTSHIFSNMFDVFRLSPDASEDDIKRMFRKVGGFNGDCRGDDGGACFHGIVVYSNSDISAGPSR